MCEKQLPILMARCLSVRYEVNQLRAMPNIPYHVDKRVMRMSWTMVSKAEDKSSRVNAVTSPLSMITTILGPLLFIVFMNDMPMSTRTICNVDMYADDSTISACGKNVEEIELKLNNDLQGISNWCDENRMVVNVEKTKIKIVTTRQKWQHLDKTDVNICIKGETPSGRNERLHGLHVDNFLTWKAHIQNIHNTIAENLALLCRIKQYLPYKARTCCTTATFYHTWITAAHSGAMQQHQIASTYSKDVLPE